MEFNDITNVGATHRTHCDCNPLHRHVHIVPMHLLQVQCPHGIRSVSLSALTQTGQRLVDDDAIAADDDDDVAAAATSTDRAYEKEVEGEERMRRERGSVRPWLFTISNRRLNARCCTLAA